MQRLFLGMGVILSVTTAIFATGCGNSNPAGAPNRAVTKSENVQTGTAENSVDKLGEADPAITKAMAELSTEDRSVAIKQAVCPVSGEALGKMGPPLKIEVKGQTVFLCCAGCKDKLLANADEYLAKIKR